MKALPRSLAPLPLALMLAVGACGGDEDPPPPPPPSADPTLADVTSCYERVDFPDDPAASDRAVFILLDETTGLDDHLRDQLASNAAQLTMPGTTIALFRFSDTSRGHHIARVGTAVIEPPVPEAVRDDRPVNALNALDRCLDGQAEFAVRAVRAEVMRASQDASGSFSHSEIMGSLVELARAVREAPGEDKLVLLASDMLEHSSATSFYSSRDLRLIDPEAEMAKAQSHRLTGDFGDARIAVIGAGLLPPDAQDGQIRPVERLNALRQFWQGWFAASNAELVAWGQPDLSAPVR